MKPGRAGRAGGGRGGGREGFRVMAKLLWGVVKSSEGREGGVQGKGRGWGGRGE